MGENAGTAITDLLAALGQVLIIIAIGFISAKLKMIPPGAAGGIGLIVGTFALPALFLLNAASMDIGSFDIRVLSAILLARYAMVVLASGASRLLDMGTTNPKGSMGIYALFCTQSNDVAIGLPIVKAIYPVDSYPANFPGYLIIVSTLQVVLVNPVCITLIEWGKSETVPPEPNKKQPAIYCTVIKGVATSPLVVGSVVGVILNLSFGRDFLTDQFLGDTLTTIGNAFTFSALFLTGMSIEATENTLHRRSSQHTLASTQSVPTLAEPRARAGEHVLVVALVLGKSLILPILIRLALSLLLPDASVVPDVRDFGYLYGTLPVASLPVVLANQNQLRPAMVAIASVASTFVSMPLLVASSAIFLSPMSENIYDAHAYTSKGSCFVSILLLCLLFAVFKRSNPRWTATAPMLMILHLAASQFMFHVLLLGCEYAGGKPAEGSPKDFFYWFSFYARTSMNTWLSNVALFFVLLARTRFRSMTPIKMWVMYSFGWIFPFVLMTAGYYMGKDHSLHDMEGYHATCWYRTTNQVYPDMVLTLLYMVTFLGMFVIVFRTEQQPLPVDHDLHQEHEVWNQVAASDLRSKEDLDHDLPQEPAQNLLRSKPDEVWHEPAQEIEDKMIPNQVAAGDLHSKEDLNSYLGIDFGVRVKVILAIGFVRLCFLLTLQLQMLSHVSPDGSFNVQMLFAVLLVDGGGAITALVFLWANPVLGEIVQTIVSVCSKALEGVRHETPWLGDDQTNGELNRQPWSAAFAEQFGVRPDCDQTRVRVCRAHHSRSAEDLEHLARTAPNSVSDTQYMYISHSVDQDDAAGAVDGEDVCGRSSVCSMPTTIDELSNSNKAPKVGLR